MKRFAFVALSFCAFALAGSTARAASTNVSIKSGGNEYHPDTVHVGVGDTVTWTNDDQTLLPTTSHTVTADNGSFDSGPIRERSSFEHVFTTPGTFTYHCSVHAGMSGTVVVSARPSRTPTPTPTPTPTKTVRPSVKPSASKSPRPSASASSAASATPSIDPSSVSSNSSSAGTIISIAIVSIAVLIGLGYFVYLRLVRDR